MSKLCHSNRRHPLLVNWRTCVCLVHTRLGSIPGIIFSCDVICILYIAEWIRLLWTGGKTHISHMSSYIILLVYYLLTFTSCQNVVAKYVCLESWGRPCETSKPSLPNIVYIAPCKINLAFHLQITSNHTDNVWGSHPGSGLSSNPRQIQRNQMDAFLSCEYCECPHSSTSWKELEKLRVQQIWEFHGRIGIRKNTSPECILITDVLLSNDNFSAHLAEWRLTLESRVVCLFKARVFLAVRFNGAECGRFITQRIASIIKHRDSAANQWSSVGPVGFSENEWQIVTNSDSFNIVASSVDREASLLPPMASRALVLAPAWLRKVEAVGLSRKASSQVQWASQVAQTAAGRDSKQSKHVLQNISAPWQTLIIWYDSYDYDIPVRVNPVGLAHLIFYTWKW